MQSNLDIKKPTDFRASIGSNLELCNFIIAHRRSFGSCQRAWEPLNDFLPTELVTLIPGSLMGFNHLPNRKGEDMLTLEQKIKCIIILAPYLVLLWMFLARLGRSEAK